MHHRFLRPQCVSSHIILDQIQNRNLILDQIQNCSRFQAFAFFLIFLLNKGLLKLLRSNYTILSKSGSRSDPESNFGYFYLYIRGIMHHRFFRSQYITYHIILDQIQKMIQILDQIQNWSRFQILALLHDFQIKVYYNKAAEVRPNCQNLDPDLIQNATLFLACISGKLCIIGS